MYVYVYQHIKLVNHFCIIIQVVDVWVSLLLVDFRCCVALSFFCNCFSISSKTFSTSSKPFFSLRLFLDMFVWLLLLLLSLFFLLLFRFTSRFVTNIFSVGRSGSEETVRKSLLKIMGRLKKRIVMTSFASNVARMETIFHCAEKNV